jgi:hypothetical protein
MAVPYREWFLIDRRTVWYNSVNNAADTHDKWADSVLTFPSLSGQPYGLAGFQTGTIPPKYYGYYCRFKPRGGFDWDAINLGDIVDYRIGINVNLKTNTAACSTFEIFGGEAFDPQTPLEFSFSTGNGRHYDGINDFAYYPSIVFADEDWDSSDITLASLPLSLVRGGCAYRSGVGPLPHMGQDSMNRNGFIFFISNFVPAIMFPDNTSCTVGVDPVSVRLRYHNPVVNSLSRNRMTAAGGVPLVLTGLGFDNDDTELTNVAGNPNSSLPWTYGGNGWFDDVTDIYFYGRGAAPDYTLQSTLGDFTVDSNTQITIASMPAMQEGAYDIYLSKRGRLFDILGVYVGAYAGDWNAEADGRLYRGGRFVFQVGPGTGPGKPIICTKWKFKNALGSVFRYYSPIDIIAPDVFYDGRIMKSSSVSRAISDQGGLFAGTDMDFGLSNADKEFSKLLAQYYLKNQIVEVFYAWDQGPEGLKQTAAKLVVDDYSLAGPEFAVKLRDISALYFKKKVPLYICTLEEYPNIHENAVGKPMPEVLGLAESTAADNAGAVEAVYIDTTIYKYLAARGSLTEIMAVYADGQTVAPAGYSVTYEDGGRTYITFTSDQETKKITFNCKGYMFGDWNSANGYVQNPAWVIAFFLSFLMEVPENFINLASFAALAATFTALGFGTSGKLILQKDQDAEAPLKELLYTFGTMSCFDTSGRFQVERKDITDFTTSLTIFAQIDTLEHPIREFNTGAAFNRMRARWDAIPAADYYLQSKLYEWNSSITDLEQALEPSAGADFPWTDSEALVDMRCQEELLRYGYGCPRYRFSVSLDWIDVLDLFTNFKLQDPFAIEPTGAGDVGRYCYVESLLVDFESRRIEVVAADMSYILRLYMILGDETELADNYSTASEWMKIYGYLSDELTGRFANGDIGKLLLDENR